MQDFQNSNSNDEIDLRELFITLWAYKLFIAGTCALGVVFGGYYALNTDKKFKSIAIFKLDQGASSGISIGGELGALASLAGIGNGMNNSTLAVDQYTGRIFIQSLDAKLNFYSDPFFNTYNPNRVDPIWRSIIKRSIGWQKPTADAQEVIWQGIMRKYSKYVQFGETKDGAHKIEVMHVNAQRAAQIANVIMGEIISIKKSKKDADQDQQLNYLSNTLAMALMDVEVTQSDLKEFSLENSALPLESFAAESLKLEDLREQLSRASELYDAVSALSLIIQNKDIDQNNYLALRQKFPIVDQTEFRRVLGQSEIISSWSWPKASTVSAVSDTLLDRKSRLQSQINTSQKNAERSGQALETFAKLERAAKVATATYTVLIEQVKAQSMVAGFRPDKTEVYEYASASINPSVPNRILILLLGAVLGLFVGAGLSLALALRRGVYYSKNSLKIGAQARLAASIRTLLPLRNKSLDNVNTMLVKKPRSVLRDMAVEIHKSTASQVVVTSSRAKMTGNGVAWALASYMQSDTMKVAVINFSSKDKKMGISEDKISVGSFDVTESADQISILIPGNDLSVMESLSHKDFWEKIQSLNSTFDLVFLCADNDDAISLLSALEGQKMFHVTLARTKNTKSAVLQQMNSLLPIQGLLHD
jgi:uncharacterized protein involved in exopolysaccharide biosynthesis